MDDFNVQQVRNQLGFTGSKFRMFLRWIKRNIHNLRCL